MTGRGSAFSGLGRRAADRLLDWWWLDAVIAAVAAALAAWFVHPRTGLDIVGALTLEDRRSAYSDLINIAALFGGFGTLAFTMYLGWNSRGVSSVKKAVGQRLLVMWLAAIATPWVCAAVIWTAKVMDRGVAVPTNPARWVALGAMLLVVLTLVRSVWLFAELARLEQNPPTATRETAPRSIGINRRSA